jgi:hypothetical protein
LHFFLNCKKEFYKKEEEEYVRNWKFSLKYEKEYEKKFIYKKKT